MDGPNLVSFFYSEQRVGAVEQAILSIHALAEKMGAGGGTSIGDSLKDSAEKVEKASDGLAGAYDEAKDLVGAHAVGISKFSIELQKLGNDLASAVKKVGEALDTLGHKAFRLYQAPENALQTALGNVPVVGGFLQLALEDHKRDASYAAAGRQSILGFAGNDNLTKGQVEGLGGALGERMRGLDESFLARPADVMKVFDTFAQAGVKLNDALQQPIRTIDGFGNTLAETSLGIDRMFQAAAGTTAKFATDLSKNTNTPIAESVDLVRELGAVSKGTGLSMRQMIDTILQTASTLRLQNADAKALAVTYVNMEETFRKLSKPGTDAIKIADLSTQALGGMGSFVSGMSRSLKGFIAQDVAKAMGHGDMDFIDAFMEMDTGFQFKTGGNGKDFTQVAAQSAFNRLSENGMQGGDLYQLLISQGMSPLLARFMMKTDGKGFDDDAYENERKRYEDADKAAKELQPLNNSTFDTTMKQIQQVMLSLGSLTSTLLGSILRAILGTGEAIIGILSGTMDRGVATKRAGAMFQEIGGNIVDEIMNSEGKWEGLMGTALPTFKKAVGYNNGSFMPNPNTTADYGVGQGTADFAQDVAMKPLSTSAKIMTMIAEQVMRSITDNASQEIETVVNKHPVKFKITVVPSDVPVQRPVRSGATP